MNRYLAGFRLQTALLRRAFGDLHTLLTVPVYTLIFLAMTDGVHRPGLSTDAVLAPALMGLWFMAVFTAGDLIVWDRHHGTLEPTVAAPGSLAPVITGRIGAVTLLSFVVYVESWAVGAGYGLRLTVHHPLVFLAGVVATAFATACTAAMIATLLVLPRNAQIYQNSVSWPLFLLSGIIVPISALPDWLRPLSRLSFLYWSAGLLRSALGTHPVDDALLRLTAVVLLGTVGAGAAAFLLRKVLTRLRVLGTLGYS
ncbi:ABC transporter permease [Streptomyces cavernae]|uniref:ABC transporter permease n=1 Tax=Streptomyces cavernae TaxID=2259034 RepID=UPI001391BD06|nr:ABC transporter permease [Streptomyces cavernae]